MYLQYHKTGAHPHRWQHKVLGLQPTARGLGEQQRKACYTLPSNGKEGTVQVAIKICTFFLTNKNNLPTTCFNRRAESRWAIINTALGKNNNALRLNLVIFRQCWCGSDGWASPGVPGIISPGFMPCSGHSPPSMTPPMLPCVLCHCDILIF